MPFATRVVVPATTTSMNKQKPKKYVLIVVGFTILCLVVGFRMNRQAVQVERTQHATTSVSQKDNTYTYDKALQAKQQQAQSLTEKLRARAADKRVQQRLKDSHGYRLCQLTNPSPVFHAPPLKVDKKVAPLPIRYQCAGAPYEDVFGSKLLALLDAKKQQSTAPTWGQRPRPVPLPTALEKGSANLPPPRTNILVFGSSHLRQVITAMMCQYSELVLQVKKIWGPTKESLATACTLITLKDKVHIWLVVNPPLIYSAEWQSLLETHILKMPLRKMDLVILSRFHKYSAHQGHLLWNFLDDHQGIPRDNNSKALLAVEPPGFLDVVHVYEGPIVYVGLFATYANATLAHVQTSIQALWEGRTPPEETVWKSSLYHRPQPIQQALEYQFSAKAKNKNVKEANPISEQAQELFTTKGKPPPVQRHRPQAHSHRHRDITDQTSDAGDGDGDGGWNGRQRRRRRLEGDSNNNQDNDDEEDEEQPQPLTPPTRPKRKPILQRRTNLMAINARAYVEPLGECSTDSFKLVSTCNTDTTDERHKEGHRCFGSQGGHADLVAWDVIEAIYKLLHKTKKYN